MKLARAQLVLPFIPTMVVACGGAEPPPAVAPAAPAVSVAAPAAPAAPAKERVNVTLADVGLDADATDRSVDPCTDFYSFACGGWLKKAEIPADKPRWGRFQELAQRNEQDLRDILEDAAAGKTAGADAKKLGDFYGACMDEKAIDKEGARPIKPLLDLAARVHDAKSLVATVAKLHAQSIWAFFDIDGSADFDDATRNIAHIDQNGLGMPDRDYYVKDDDKSKDLRAKYVAHVERMMKLAGSSAKEAKDAAADVMDLETTLAKASRTKVERRDPKKLNNKIGRKGVVEKAPDVDWKLYFDTLGFPAIADVNVTSIPFLEQVNALVKTAKPAALRRYLAWTIVRSTAKTLSKPFVDEAFTMEQALSGQKEQRARWKRCVEATDQSLGELLAQAFVAKRFAGDAKKATEGMVRAIAAAFERELAGLDWMDAETRAKALEKRRAMAYLIGYPGKWRTYDFPVDRKTWAKDALAARALERRRQLAKVGTPVDRDEWVMTPPTVNAYYDPQRNHMVFPAGILQPPFYNPKASLAVNLGGMGMVVGHELTHGFDDEGSQFAADGNLKNWWQEASRKRFDEKTQCVADEYGAFETVPGVKLDGKLTLGENVADGGGVLLALQALHDANKDATKTVVADGLDEDQQLFVSVGQVWCFKAREEWARMAAQVDPHSPPRFRVNGSMSNLPEFAAAFQCKPGSPMRRENACRVW